MSLTAKSETVQNRRSICLDCPHLKTFLGAYQCGKCKCFLKAKTKLSNARCPIGKW